MRNRIAYSLAVAATALLCACSALSNIDLTDQESVNELLPASIEKHIDPQSTVYEMSLLTTSDFSVKMDIVTIVFLEPGAAEAKKYSITVVGNQSPRESKVPNTPSYDKTAGGFIVKKYTTENGIKLADIDFSQVASNVAKASEMVTAEGHSVDGISYYDITFDGNPGNTGHKFRLLSKDNTKMGTHNGRASMVTEYYEFDFEADASGNVKYKGD